MAKHLVKRNAPPVVFSFLSSLFLILLLSLSGVVFGMRLYSFVAGVVGRSPSSSYPKYIALAVK
jgi:hypothetical protein